MERNLLEESMHFVNLSLPLFLAPKLVTNVIV
jgi:hypothetical protein